MCQDKLTSLNFGAAGDALMYAEMLTEECNGWLWAWRLCSGQESSEDLDIDGQVLLEAGMVRAHCSSSTLPLIRNGAKRHI